MKQYPPVRRYMPDIESRIMVLALVHEYGASYRQTHQRYSVWTLDGTDITGGRLYRDLWWLWEAGRIEFTRREYPTGVRLTKRGYEILKEAEL